MVTISIDGPKALHEEMRGLPGSFDKGLETFRRLRGIRKSNFQTVIGMTLMAKNASRVDETLAAIRQVIPDFRRSELHLNVGHESGHYFDNVGYPVEHAPRRHPARDRRSSEEERLVAPPGEVPRGPVPGAHQQVLRDRQVAAAVHGAVLVVLRGRLLEPVSLLDLEREGRQPARQRLRPARRSGTTRAASSSARRSSTSAARTAGRRAKPIRRSSAISPAPPCRAGRPSCSRSLPKPPEGPTICTPDDSGGTARDDRGTRTGARSAQRGRDSGRAVARRAARGRAALLRPGLGSAVLPFPHRRAFRLRRRRPSARQHGGRGACRPSSSCTARCRCTC